MESYILCTDYRSHSGLVKKKKAGTFGTERTEFKSWIDLWWVTGNLGKFNISKPWIPYLLNRYNISNLWCVPIWIINMCVKSFQSQSMAYQRKFMLNMIIWGSLMPIQDTTQFIYLPTQTLNLGWWTHNIIYMMYYQIVCQNQYNFRLSPQ